MVENPVAANRIARNHCCEIDRGFQRFTWGERSRQIEKEHGARIVESRDDLLTTDLDGGNVGFTFEVVIGVWVKTHRKLGERFASQVRICECKRPGERRLCGVERQIELVTWKRREVSRKFITICIEDGLERRGRRGRNRRRRLYWQRGEGQ